MINFGVAHSLFVTLLGPIINKVVQKKDFLPKAFAFMKIIENLGTMVLTFIAGYIKE